MNKIFQNNQFYISNNKDDLIWIFQKLKNKISIDTDVFIKAYNDIHNTNISDLNDIPIENLKDIIIKTQVLVSHICSINTIILKVWEKNIDEKFMFDSSRVSEFLKNLAASNYISSDILISYINDRKKYILSFLEKSDKEQE